MIPDPADTLGCILYAGVHPGVELASHSGKGWSILKIVLCGQGHRPYGFACAVDIVFANGMIEDGEKQLIDEES